MSVYYSFLRCLFKTPKQKVQSQLRYKIKNQEQAKTPQKFDFQSSRKPNIGNENVSTRVEWRWIFWGSRLRSNEKWTTISNGALINALLFAPFSLYIVCKFPSYCRLLSTMSVFPNFPPNNFMIYLCKCLKLLPLQNFPTLWTLITLSSQW